MKNNYLILLLFLFLLKATTGFSTKHTIISTIQGVNFVFSPDTVTASLGDTIVFSLNIVHFPKEVSQATWNVNDSTSNGGFVLPNGGGTYVINQIKTYYYVCGVHFAMGMKGRIFVLGTGVNPVSATSSGLDVFPNPFSTGVTFKTNLPAGKENQLRIFDRAGRCIFEKDNISQVQYLDLSSLPSGVYFVAIKSEDIILEKKLMVSR